MTNDTILAAAIAGYRRYYFGRPGYAWDTDSNAMRIAWERLAALVLNGNVPTPRECHEEYTQLHAYPVPWNDISTRTRDRWVQAFHAMQAVGRDAMRTAA
jgi:hypothetical protein